MLSRRNDELSPALPSVRPWRIELLGGVRLIYQNEPIGPLQGRRGLVLFARLACFPERIHPREVLAEELWPEEDAETNAQRFRKTLSRLREELGPEADSLLLVKRYTLAIQADALTTDVAEFQQAVRAARLADSSERKKQALERAIALYKGEFLPGFYEDWIVSERERLHNLFLDVQQKLQTLPEESKGVSLPAPAIPPLPSPVTRFFGREQEIDQATLHLTDTTAPAPLLTLIGPGGAGKTRLALVLGHALARHFDGKVAFVQTQQAANTAELPERLRDALGLRPAHGADSRQQVEAFLNSLPAALLIWDNFEHHTEEGAAYLQSLRRRFPNLAHLVTSRRKLGLSGEQELPLLPLPTPDQASAPERLLEFPSIALFCDRAHTAQHDFSLTPANAEAVRQLCLYLEGIPLALELAAPLVSMLSVDSLRERVTDRRFALLKNRHKDSAGHQGSLHEVLQSSYALLPSREQRLLGRLSVFVGGFFLDRAEAVCVSEEERESDPLGVLDGLSLLREHSFLTTETLPGGQLRFRMLETVRDFATSVLPADDKKAVREQHTRVFQEIARETPSHLSTGRESAWMILLEADALNLRTAVESLAETDLSQALQMIANLDHFYIFRGRMAEGRTLLTYLLGKDDEADTFSRLMASNSAAMLALFAGDFPAVLDYSAMGEALASQLDDPKWLFDPSLCRLRALVELGHLTEADNLVEKTLPLFSEPTIRSLVLDEWAKSALYQNKYALAGERFRMSRGMRDISQDTRSRAYHQYWEATVLLYEGDLRSAETLLRESLEFLEQAGFISHIPTTQVTLATLLLLHGDVDAALSLATESAQRAAQQGHRFTHLDAQRLRSAILVEAGRPDEASLPLSQVLTLCQENDPPHLWAGILEAIADLAADREDAAPLLLYADRLRRQSEIERSPLETIIHRRVTERLSSLGGQERDREQTLLLARNILRERSDDFRRSQDKFPLRW